MSNLDAIFDGVIEESLVKPPIAVLKELGQGLEKRTQGLLVGKVGQTNYSNDFKLEFCIVAPSLNNYSYEVFSVNHNLNFYPLELTITATRLPNNSFATEEIENQEEFEKKLKIIFSSSEVKKVINGLLAQIKSA
jgi:hypothetical protein